MTKRASKAEIIHGILTEKPVGYLFTVQGLTERLIKAGHNFSSGAISGFIDRALKKERISIESDTGQDGSRGRIYKIEDREPWDFQAPSIGSYPGRTVHGGEHKMIGKSLSDLAYIQPERKLSQPVMTFIPEGKQITLSQRLIELAAEVEIIENKSLSNYTTDELMEELKTRLK